MDQFEEGTIRRYLLGQLEGASRAAIDERILRDDAFFSAVQAVEGGLIDDYVVNDLTAEDHAFFEQRFLTTKERREQVEFVRQLRARLSQLPVAHAKPATRAVTSPLPWRALAVAATVLAAVGVGVWRFVLPTPPGAATVTIPGETRPGPPGVTPSPGTAARSPNLFAVTLTPGVRRAIPSSKPIVIPRGTDTVRFHLLLNTPPTALRYQAQLEPTATGLPWVGDATTLPGADGSLVVDTPVKFLAAGASVLTLYVVRDGRRQEIEDYSLEIRLQ